MRRAGSSCTCPEGTFGDGLFCQTKEPCVPDLCGTGSCSPTPWGGARACLPGSGGASCSDDCSEVAFTDELLEELVRSSVGIPHATVAGADLLSSSFEVPRLGIERVASLSGMECWSPLKRLDLHGQAVSDLTPLQHLQRLSELDSNPVSDLAPLEELFSLTQLSLDQLTCPETSPNAVDLAPSSLLLLEELSVSGRPVSSLVTAQTSSPPR